MERKTELVAEPGDRVEVQFLGQWTPAVVTHVLPNSGSPVYRTELRTGEGRPFWVQSLAIRKPEQPLPTAKELHGSDPDFTGEQSTDEYLREIRGAKQPGD